MESNSSEAATSNAASSTSVTGGLDMYPHQQSQASHQDFKMPSSLGEVQRIIGLSLSKIQMGRNQRGGLPLHKNLLVATVLNKARDLYMQETMYMNYKMMTGQFAAAASAASASNTNSQMEYSQHYHHHYGMGMSSNQNETDMDELEPVEANEADYDEDSESDVEDECDVTSVPVASSNNVNPSTTYPILCNMHSPEPATPSPADHQPHHLPNPGAASMPAHEAVNNPTTPATSDEGFIDEPDCDCDARNFSTSESRVPFQYCYHCAPFHPSSGRGPTLVPSPSPTPASAAAATATSSHTKASASPSKNESCDGSDPTNAAVIYDMDSQTTKDSTEAGPSSVVRGTKRRRSSSEEEPSDEQETCKKRSRESTDLDSSHQLNCSQDESGYQSADSSHTEVRFFCSSTCLCLTSQLNYPIFFCRYFIQLFEGQLQAALQSPTPKELPMVETPWKSTKSPVLFPSSPSASTSWQPQRLRLPAPKSESLKRRTRRRRRKRRSADHKPRLRPIRKVSLPRIRTVKVTLPVIAATPAMTTRLWQVAKKKILSPILRALLPS